MIDLTKAMELSPFDFDNGPSEEEERDFWNGEGNLIFTVTANRDDVFEIDIEEYSGCVDGFDEGVGIEWGLKEGYLGISREELHEGYTYYYDEITVSWYRGDGWTTDDDSDYYVGDMRSERLPLIPYLKLIINNAWWFNIGWRIREWRRSSMTDTPTTLDPREMASDLSHTGELSMVYRCTIADALTAALDRAEKAEAKRDTAWNEAIEAAIDRIDGSWTWDDPDFMADVYDDLRRNLKKGEPTC